MTSSNFTPGLLRDEHAELLDVTDGLGVIGLARHITLPQLVVCGDQSSGKSSVLQSISGVKFPVNDGLCTRFATQIVLRRCEEKSGHVSIEPGSSSSEEQRQNLKAFDAVDADFENIPIYMEKAKAVMGLAGDSSFSDATLRVELSGPDQPHLTLVDLPGLIHARERSQSKEDVETVRRVVRKYMEQERTIILAILSAKSDPGTQEILEMAQEYDPTGSRTLGIITKPDLLHSGSPTERKVLSYARNEQNHFGLGWHVVRNADYTEYADPTYDRQCKEHELFSRSPWNGLPETSLGAEALIARLGQCSLDLTRRELPKVVREIESEIAKRRSRLQLLGPPRDSVGEQRLYLIRIAEKFQRVVLDGVEGQFDRDRFFTKPSRRLRAEVRNLTDAFADSIRLCGHSYEVTGNSWFDLHPTRRDAGPTLPACVSVGHQPLKIDWEEYLKIIHDEIVQVSRGQELPTTFDPLLVRQVFQRQSRNWEDIALNYADKVFSTARKFVEELLEQNTERATYEKLSEEFIQPAMSLSQHLLHSKVKELLTPYTRSYPFSKNPRFVQELKEIELGIHEDYPKNRENAAAIFACWKLAYWEHAYYKFALDTFVDNMATLAIENCVLANLHEIFSPSQIAVMDGEILERLASESAEAAKDRASANKDLATFEKALLICRRCWVGRPGHFKSRSVNPPTAAESQLLSPQLQHRRVGDITSRADHIDFISPDLNQTPHEDAGQIKNDHQARPGTSASMASSILAAGERRSHTRTPSPVHSRSVSLSQAESSSSVSSPYSSPKSGNGKAKAFKVEVKEVQ